MTKCARPGKQKPTDVTCGIHRKENDLSAIFQADNISNLERTDSDYKKET